LGGRVDQAQPTANEPAKAEAQARATRLLLDLIERHEGYRSVVTEQLLSRVGAGADLAQLSPPLLDALVDKGRAEAARLATATGIHLSPSHLSRVLARLDLPLKKSP